MKMQITATTVLAIVLVAVLIGGCYYPAPYQAPAAPTEDLAAALTYQGAVYFPPGGDQLVVASGGEIEVQSGADLTVDGDTTLANLTVSGGVTGTNVLTTGDQTVAGIKTFSTAIAVGAVTGPSTLTGPTAVATATPAVVINNLGAANNALEVRDASTPVFVVGQAGVSGNGGGALTVSGGVLASNASAVTGPTAIATATPALIVDNLGAANVALEVRDSATPVFQVLNGGAVAANAVYSYAPVAAKVANYAVTTADTGTVIKSSGSITMTLPGAVAGLNYCIVNYDGGDLTIDFTDSADFALNEVNSPGDRVTNTTAYDWICLTAIDATNWMTLGSLGTWADGN